MRCSLKNTIEDALKQSRADTEIIAVLDGESAKPEIPRIQELMCFILVVWLE